MSNTPPFSPVGSFIPREEFAPRVVSSSAVASLTLSGAGGIRVTGVQQEVSSIFIATVLLDRLDAG